MNVFIIGGTRGIGFGLVNEFLKLGHSVFFTGTSETTINKAVKSLSGNFKTAICDIRKESSIEEAMKQALDFYETIDVWINNAGVNQDYDYFWNLSETNIKKVLDTNIYGMITGTKVAIKQMKNQGYGIVYNMEGLGSNNMMIPKTIIYASSKKLLSFFSRAANKELKEYKNITVGTLSPGMVYTDFLKGSLDRDQFITKIIANEVKEVTPYLVKKMIKGKKHIVWLNNFKVFIRFLIYPFKKKQKQSK